MDRFKTINPYYKSIGFAIAGAFTSYLAWGENLYFMPAALFFVFLYGLVDKRRDIFILSGSYYLTGSRGLPEGVATFFSSSISNGIVLWLLAALAFVLTYSLLWSKNPKRKAWGFIAATIIMAIPPLGIVGWLSPLAATGMLLPNTGLIGLIIMFAIFYAATGTRKKFKLYTALACIALCANLAFIPVDNQAVEWHGVQTEIPFQTGEDNFEASLLMVNSVEAHLIGTDKPNVVFPESALGSFNNPNLVFWKGYARQYKKNIFAGSSYTENSKRYNVIARISPEGKLSVAYKQRMPVPVSMWRPFSDKGTQATFFQNPMILEKNNKVGYMICYEQLLVWPYIHSHMNGADIFVGAANDWWATGTTIPHIQVNTLKSWSRLLGMEYVSSMNL